MESSGKYQNILHWLLAILMVILSVWKISTGLEENMDIRFYDESYYLTQGFFHPVNTWLADYSPLYSLYYKGMSLIFKHPIDLYYASYRFWDFLLGIIIYGLLRIAGISFIPALLWGMSACTSQVGLPLWPKAGHLAMAGTAAGIAGLWSSKGNPRQQLIWTFGISLILAWGRPEFISGACLSGIGLLFFIQKDGKTLNPLIFLPLIFCLIFTALWGFPVGQSGRGLVAFGQHFVHNWRNISGQNSGDLMWDWVNWRPIFRQHFGEVQNPLGALLANPTDMMMHLWFNLRYLVYNSLVYFSETLMPKRIYGISPLALTGLILIGAESLSSFELAGKFLRSIRKNSLPELLPWFSLALPSVLAALLFQPRPHYILPLLPFFVFAAGLFFKHTNARVLQLQWRRPFVVLPVILLFILPDCRAFFQVISKGESKSEETFAENHDFFSPVSTKSLRHKTLIRELEAIPFPKSFRIFDASTGATEYLGKQLVQCGKTGFEMNYSALKNFPRFLDSANIKGIFLHETIRYDRFFTENPEWQKIKNQPEKCGWYKMAVGKNGDSLILRKEIRIY